MAVLNSREAAQLRARKHAQRAWQCSICNKTCHGNGGKASHQNAHLRAAGLPKGDWLYLVRHPELFGRTAAHEDTPAPADQLPR